MKVMAIANPKSPLTPEQLQPYMSREVPATLQHYLDGKIDQFWFREKFGPIFLLNATSIEEAETILKELPLVAANVMHYDLLPVSPLLPLGRLIQGK
jgi:hypothetical protein